MKAAVVWKYSDDGCFCRAVSPCGDGAIGKTALFLLMKETNFSE